MSSQGATGATGYAYPLTRDAQDWTRQLKERRLYKSYADGTKDMSPPWMKFGNDIRLSFDQGKFSCGNTLGCTGSAFSGVIPLGLTFPPFPPGDFVSFLNFTMYVKGSGSPTPVITDPSTWGPKDNTNLNALMAGTGGTPCAGGADGTIIPRKGSSPSGYAYISLHVTGFYTAPVSGSYSFHFQTDDGVTMILNGVTITSHPGYSAAGTYDSTPIALTAGTKYPMEILWSNGTGGLNLCITQINVNSSNIQPSYPFNTSCSPTP